MNTFCTIITSEYLPLALTLQESIRKYNDAIDLHVLVVDTQNHPELAQHERVKYVSMQELANFPLTDLLYKKYAHINSDHFRWSLKSILVSYLLEIGFQKVIYLDSDIYFFNEYEFLFDDLDDNAIILTSHWANPWPLKNQEAFIQLLTKGVFNAGFIGSNRHGLQALRWWAEACHFGMGHSTEYIIHDDQRYLDLLPLLFEKVKLIQHKGCNLMAGNYEECRREFKDENVLIDGVYPIIFIHFNQPLIQQILMGFDPLLVPYFDEYKTSIAKNGGSLKKFLSNVERHVHPTLLNKLKWRLRVRTRIKTLLFKLAEKL